MARTTNKTKTTPEEGRNTATFFSGMSLVGCGTFLTLSLLTVDIAVDPSTAAETCATGLFGAWAAYGMLLTLGSCASFFLCALICAWGAHLMKGGKLLASWPKVLGGVTIVTSLAIFADTLLPGGELPQRGLLAYTLAEPALLYLGRVGLLIISGGAVFCGAVISFGEAVFDLCRYIGKNMAILGRTAGGFCKHILELIVLFIRPKAAAIWVSSADRAVVVLNKNRDRISGRGSSRSKSEQSEAVDIEAIITDDRPEPAPAFTPEPESNSMLEPEPEFTPYGEVQEEDEETYTDDDSDMEEIPVVEIKEPKRKKNTSKLEKVEKPEKIDRVIVDIPTENPDYQLPPLNLLDPPGDQTADCGDVQKRAHALERTLSEFKIEGKVVQIERGPRVTLYEMTLAPGIRLTKVINLADNIAMALKASNVRIIAPIPGKDTIGIEIPNIEKELVTVREIVSSINRTKRKEMIPICLGKDVSGKPVVADLAKMPHLLIAGATGSGKSVCINSILLSFLLCCKPEELKTIMVDPKVVELSRFKDIPHLMSPVITDMKKAVGVLEWACQEMDQRYEQLSMVGVNNLAKFNALGKESIAAKLGEAYTEEELDLFPKSLPFIAIIIDELADLMLVAGKEVEVLITRLAAKSRAVGIHLILATQRPSVDVITGLIKANMPTRIAFQVASRVDSRTILDQNGAETLLGAGDMLYLPPGVGKVTRAQGVFVSDEELFKIVDFCKAQQAPNYHSDLQGPVIGGADNTDIKDFDDLFIEAGLAIIESGRGSVSLLQRKLGIGYGRASRIVDQLASVGLLGPFREGKAREIMMTGEEFCSTFGASLPSSMNGDNPGTVAGLREDEREPDDVPWSDEEDM